MTTYQTEPSGLPWWVTFAGHGLLTSTAAAGVVTASGPVRWAWLLVVLVGLAVTKRAWEDHAAAMAVASHPEPAEVSQPDRSAGW